MSVAGLLQHPEPFRSNTNTIYQIMNSAFVDDKITEAGTNSFFIIRGGDNFSSESAVFDRLFFELGETNSILEEAKSSVDFPFKESAALVVVDSTEKMMEVYGYGLFNSSIGIDFWASMEMIKQSILLGIVIVLE